MEHPVLRAVREAVENRDLAGEAGQTASARRPARVAVACSGGPDSVALAHAAVTVLGSRVELVHVDHGLRPDSEVDGQRVREFAERLAVEAVVTKVEVDQTSASLEAAARRARYAAFEDLAERRGWAAVLLGHTASDQAETVLMRILRGTGVNGLAAIPERRGRYLRPLLGVWRADVEDYLEGRSLVASQDPMNRDEAIARVRIRRRWLPELRRENPNIDEALVRLAASAREQREVLEFAVENLLRDAQAHGSVSARALATAPPAVAKGALRQLAGEAGLGTLDAIHLEATLELVRRPKAGTVQLDLPRGALCREYDRLRFVGPGEEPATDEPELTDLQSLARVEGPDGPFRVRRWQAGDRMRPERLRGRSRKLSDLFADAQVPRRLRSRALVVVRESDETIVWAQHIGNAYGSTVEVTLTHP